MRVVRNKICNTENPYILYPETNIDVRDWLRDSVQTHWVDYRDDDKLFLFVEFHNPDDAERYRVQFKGIFYEGFDDPDKWDDPFNTI